MTQKKGKVFNFKDQMRIGDIGEADFIKIYEKLEPIKSLKNRKIDFTLNNGKTIELKTDSYSMEKTPNFFMEKKRFYLMKKLFWVDRGVLKTIRLIILYITT